MSGIERLRRRLDCMEEKGKNDLRNNGACFAVYGIYFNLQSKANKGYISFFNLTNTTAMRGFWCIIVILVHIPAVYQNRIQDLMGSFAYIGVTFFFMTSAYGLKVGAKKNPDSTKVFWRRRLPKLLIPMFLVNVLTMVMHLIECKDISPLDLLSVNMWVVWLLACYAIYWAVNIFVDMEGIKIFSYAY